MPNIIRDARLASGLSQSQLATRTGLHKLVISKLERGERSIAETRIKTIKALASALNISIDEIAKNV